MDIKLSKQVLKSISKSLEISGFHSSNLTYRILIGNKDVAKIEIDYNEGILRYDLDEKDFWYDKMIRKTLFEDVLKEAI
mgnify:CR=1 FL=1